MVLKNDEEAIRTMTDEYALGLRRHYESVWSQDYMECQWPLNVSRALPTRFRVLEFPPFGKRDMWTYATCCMSQPEDDSKIEVHLFSPEKHEGHVELLTAIAHYHRTSARVGCGDTVNFGRSWFPEGTCDHGLLSLPYLDGPDLEWLRLPDGNSVRFLWLIPVTAEEVAFKTEFGVEALEVRFEETGLNYLDPIRSSVVSL
jgi:hypothetical protein